MVHVRNAYTCALHNIDCNLTCIHTMYWRKHFSLLIMLFCSPFARVIINFYFYTVISCLYSTSLCAPLLSVKNNVTQITLSPKLYLNIVTDTVTQYTRIYLMHVSASCFYVVYRISISIILDISHSVHFSCCLLFLA